MNRLQHIQQPAYEGPWRAGDTRQPLRMKEKQNMRTVTRRGPGTHLDAPDDTFNMDVRENCSPFNSPGGSGLQVGSEL